MKALYGKCQMDITPKGKGKVYRLIENGEPKEYDERYFLQLTNELIDKVPEDLRDVSISLHYLKENEGYTITEYEILEHDQQYWSHHFISCDGIKSLTRPETKEGFDARIEAWEQFYGESFEDYKGRLSATNMSEIDCNDPLDILY